MLHCSYEFVQFEFISYLIKFKKLQEMFKMILFKYGHKIMARKHFITVLVNISIN